MWNYFLTISLILYCFSFFSRKNCSVLVDSLTVNGNGTKLSCSSPYPPCLPLLPGLPRREETPDMGRDMSPTLSSISLLSYSSSISLVFAFSFTPLDIELSINAAIGSSSADQLDFSFYGSSPGSPVIKLTWMIVKDCWIVLMMLNGLSFFLNS
jgi:hypothetical protein